MTRSAKTKTNLISFIALLLLTGCSNVVMSNESALLEPRVFDTSDGRPLAVGDISKSISILTVPVSDFDHFAHEKVTDEYGEYLVTKIAYPSIDSVKNRGPNLNTFISALEFYTDFLSTQILDSIAFDSYENYPKWVKEVAPKYISNEYFEEIVNAQQNGKSGTGVIYNNFESSRYEFQKYLIPVLKRDGGPRVFNKHLWGIKAESRGAGLYIWSMGNATIIYDDTSAAIWDPLFWKLPADSALPDRYLDGKDQISQFSFQVGLALEPDGDSWKITDFENSFSAQLFEDHLPPPERLLILRDQIIK